MDRTSFVFSIVYFFINILSIYLIFIYSFQYNYDFNHQIDYEIKQILDKCQLCVNNHFVLNTFIDDKLVNVTKTQKIVGLTNQNILESINISHNDRKII